MTASAMSPRAEEIFREDLRRIILRTDRMFFWLLLGQWLFGIAIALIWSPRTWIAQYWSVHQHVLVAICLGALFLVYPLYCILRQPGTRHTRHVIAIGQMLQSALLVHVTGGRIETHFHVFGSLALLAFYRDWSVLLTASAVVYLDHLALGIWFPLSVYGVEEASFWRSAEHAFWVIFEVVFLVMACRTGIRELSAIASRQAEIETVAADLREYNAEIQTMSSELKQLNEALETRVQERTQSLTREIGERRQAQEALSQQTRVLQSILDNMGEAVIVAGPTGKFVLANPAAQGLLSPPLADVPWSEWPQGYGLFHADQETPYAADQLPLVRAIHGESSDQTELFLRNPHCPHGVLLSCNARPIRDEQGKLQGGVVVFHDITERKRAEEKLAQAREAKLVAEAASRAKDEFLSRMSHELRTPLNAILGFGQLLEMNLLSEDQRECVDQINRGGKHLLKLINEVLDIARIEAGRMPLSPEPVRVTDAIQEVLDLVRPLSAGRDIRFHLDLAGVNGHCVLADNQKLKQVLMNLLSNAIKYNREQGEVRISCEEAAPGRLRLVVSDTGPGIAAEKLHRLFVPFDRLDAEQTGVEGSGLGLALSKSLVELMGGTLTVTTEAGKGSRFCVELAQAEDPQERLPADVTQLPGSVNVFCEGRTVLYIEDNLDNLRLVQRVLDLRPGVQLVTSMQGSLGTELARQHRPDLILLDVHLADLNGEQVLGRLRAAPETQSIPVVVLSADATPRQIERLRAAGARDYLTKPIEVPRFLGIVDEVLRKEKAVS